YVSADEYRRFCAPTVPLARLAKRTFTTGETLRADLEIAHFGPKDLDAVQVTWRLETEAGETVASGVFSPGTLATGKLSAVGTLTATLKGVKAPARLRLVAAVAGTDAENDWNLWVYPDTVDVPSPTGITIA